MGRATGARAAGLQKPKALTRELSLLIDGASVAAAMGRSPAPVAAARSAAIELVEASPQAGVDSRLLIRETVPVRSS